MKKLLLLSVALFASMTLFAQTKGEKYIAFSAAASFGSENVETYDGAYTTKASSPLTTGLSVMGEFGYFIADNFRLALAIGVPFSSTPTSQSGNTWLHRNTVGLTINPNIAYYVKLANNFYYTPEIGFAYQFGSYKEDMTTSTSVNLKYSSWSLYANILALEFRVSPKIAVGAGIGSISYSNVKYTEKGSPEYIKDGQFKFNFNEAAVHVRFYL